MPESKRELTPRKKEDKMNQVRFERFNESTVIGHGITKDLNPEDADRIEGKFEEYLVKEREK